MLVLIYSVKNYEFLFFCSVIFGKLIFFYVNCLESIYIIDVKLVSYFDNEFLRYEIKVLINRRFLGEKLVGMF